MGMTGSINPQNVFNGTFTYMYVDGTEVLSLSSVKAEDEIEYGDIEQAGHLRAGKKMIGVEGTLEFTINKVSNDYSKKWAASVAAGHQPEVTIVVTEADPNALESCSRQYLGCAIENIPYVNSEPKSIQQETYKCTYQEVKVLDPA